MKIKICGITHTEDIEQSTALGVWALGFNFYDSSPRYLEPARAKSLFCHVPFEVKKVGIFIHTPFEKMINLQTNLGLDYLQVYQDFSCSDSQKKKMILVLQPGTFSDLPPLSSLHAYAFILMDASRAQTGVFGGSGAQANWEIAKYLAKQVPLILAGGLTPHNVDQAINQVQPYAVDVCSGVERKPGYKDPIKLQNFFKKVKKNV